MLCVIDAQNFHALIQDIIHSKDGPAQTCYNHIASNGNVLFDEAGHIRGCWEQVSSAHAREFVDDWIVEEVRNSVVTYSDCHGFSKIRRELALMGMPEDDAKIAALAVVGGADIILSDDIDFFDPTKKKQLTGVKREKFMLGRKGNIPKFLKKKYNVDVHCLYSFIEQFGL